MKKPFNKINFFKIYQLFFGFSLFVIVATIVTSLSQDYRLGTDFKGGLEAEVTFTNNSLDSKDLARKLQSDNLSVEVEKIISKENSFIIRIPLIDDNTLKTESFLQEKLKKNFNQVEIDQLQIIGGILSSQNKTNALYVSLIVVLLIMGYLTLRFKFRYSIAAILAIVHDVFVILFSVFILNIEVNILVIVAILTIFGYSVNDTIVLFDRIREITNKKKKNETEYKDLLNQAVQQIISRTLITSLTTLLVVLSLFISTEGIYKDFSLLLIIGIISGTYSSIYLACPTLIIWNHYRPINN